MHVCVGARPRRRQVPRSASPSPLGAKESHYLDEFYDHDLFDPMPLFEGLDANPDFTRHPMAGVATSAGAEVHTLRGVLTVLDTMDLLDLPFAFTPFMLDLCRVAKVESDTSVPVHALRG